MLVFGLFLFCWADAKILGVFNIFGVFLMFGSVSTDIIKYSIQEKIIKQHGCSEVDATLWSSIIGIFGALIVVLYNGEFQPSVEFYIKNPASFLWMTGIYIFGYIATIATLSLIVLSSAFISSIVSTVRKALTVFLSTYTKGLSQQHFIAIVVFFTGIIWHSYNKHTVRKNTRKLL